MLQHTSSRILIGLTSCVVVLSFVTYNKVKDGKKKFKKDTSATEDTDHDNKPMFEYNNKNLTRTTLEMAAQRAKRWMSFRVSGAQSMVGQVGGRSIKKKPILILDNFVMKPVNLDHRGVREIAFYEAIQASSNMRSGYKTYRSLFGPRYPKASSTATDIFFSWIDKILARKKEADTRPSHNKAEVENEMKLLHRLELLTPRYFGTVEHDYKPSSQVQSNPLGIKSNSYILLKNLTTHFSKPCVLDLKLGTQTFEPNAPEEKKLREQNKYPPQIDFGFRIVAMRVYDPSNEKAGEDGYVYYPKQFGRSLDTRESVKRALRTFLGGEDLPKDVRANRSTAIKRILGKLKLIKGWCRDNNVLAFYGASILIIYEGDTVQNELDGVQPDMARAKMIDFGRVRRQPGGDSGFLKGLVTLIALLEENLKESFWSDNYKYLA